MDIKNLQAVMTSKKAWACALAIAVPLINKIYGLDLDPETVEMVVYPLLTYIVGQGVADMGKHKQT